MNMELLLQILKTARYCEADQMKELLKEIEPETYYFPESMTFNKDSLRLYLIGEAISILQNQQEENDSN